jgi:hypothetical protein
MAHTTVKMVMLQDLLLSSHWRCIKACGGIQHKFTALRTRKADGIDPNIRARRDERFCFKMRVREKGTNSSFLSLFCSLQISID